MYKSCNPNVACGIDFTFAQKPVENWVRGGGKFLHPSPSANHEVLIMYAASFWASNITGLAGFTGTTSPPPVPPSPKVSLVCTHLWRMGWSCGRIGGPQVGYSLNGHEATRRRGCRRERGRERSLHRVCKGGF